MALTLVTAPAVEPVSLAEAKAHCYIDVSDDDGQVNALIRAAREWVETATRRALMAQTWDLKLDAFPCESIELPLSPVSSVTSITYVDTNGTTQTWSSSLYTTDLPTGPQPQRARIVPAYDQVFPTTRDVINAVTVRFVAGYGTNPFAVPQSLRAAVLMLVKHWYDAQGRSPVNVGNIVTSVPLTVDALTWAFKAF